VLPWERDIYPELAELKAA